ncbi:cytochrome P450 7B1 isoform X2 [Betta splendens]|uniref:Cytochrome P450 7B1 isoform X2 n=2 Tax=Betta splendens TaxID=158456 RepID=A0A6P7KZS8_BETSP|nr:cytochrome P450 7B1 isoform X2 [Betta splendens]
MSALLLFLLGLLPLVLFVIRGRKRRHGEPPLIKGWIPYVGKALEFSRDAHRFLEGLQETHGDVFTVHIAGKYMTFILDPLVYPNVIKQSRQLDFHEFSNKVSPVTFGYPPVDHRFPGLKEDISRTFKLLQGDSLTPLTESMMGNLMMVLRQDHLEEGGGWRSCSMFQFCYAIMFEATFLTMYGGPAPGQRHSGMDQLRENFIKFDNMFPLLIAQIPIWLLGRTSANREMLLNYLLPKKLSHWTNTSQFIKRRSELFDRYDSLRDIDKAAHHFAVLWASAGNTTPATFWAMYYLVSHPEALQVVRQELHDVLKLSGVEFSGSEDVALSREQLDRLLCLESSINESLRLCSSSMNIRVAQEDFSLRLDAERSVDVRKGDVVTLYPKRMHLDPDIYPDPETFRFDRYMQDGAEKTDFYKDGQKLKYYLMPFGSGSTMCPGRYFALNEIKQFLSLLLLYFDLELEEGQARATLDPGRAGLGILLPAADVRFRYRMRRV